jgi:hypothetical protein
MSSLKRTYKAVKEANAALSLANRGYEALSLLFPAATAFAVGWVAAEAGWFWSISRT